MTRTTAPRRAPPPPFTVEITAADGPPVDVHAWARDYVEAVLGPVLAGRVPGPPLPQDTRP